MSTDVSLARRVTDRGEPTNRQILEHLDRFIEGHEHEHKDLERRLGITATAAAMERKDVDALQLVAVDVKLLRDFKIQAEMLGKMVKWVLGGSAVTALASISALIAILSHIAATP